MGIGKDKLYEISLDASFVLVLIFCSLALYSWSTSGAHALWSKIYLGLETIFAIITVIISRKEKEMEAMKE